MVALDRVYAGEIVEMFQSPHGDSFFSDIAMLIDPNEYFLTGFNPLTGIRSFLTIRTFRAFRHWEWTLTNGFNPLTGIRSFLT